MLPRLGRQDTQFTERDLAVSLRLRILPGFEYPPAVPVQSTARLTESEAARIAAEAFGLEAEARPLEGYAVENFLLECQDGRRFVLKASADDEAEADLDFQNRLLEHLAAASFPLTIPRPVATADGRQVIEHRGESVRRRVRLLTT